MVETETDERLDDQRELYKPREVAKIMGVSRKKIYSLLADGWIKHIRIGYSIRIPSSEILRISREVHMSKAELNHMLAPPERMTCGVYILRAANGWFKIGQSKDLRQRLFCLRSMIPEELTIVAFKSEEKPSVLEAKLHIDCMERRVKGEWFALSQSEIAMIVKTHKFVSIDEGVTGFLKKLQC